MDGCGADNAVLMAVVNVCVFSVYSTFKYLPHHIVVVMMRN